MTKKWYFDFLRIHQILVFEKSDELPNKPKRPLGRFNRNDAVIYF